MTKSVPKSKSLPNNLLFLNRDRGYRFTDRDPVLEEICTIITQSGKTTREISDLTAQTGGIRISHATVDNWLNGRVRRPQNFTVTWVGYVLGYKRGWSKI